MLKIELTTTNLDLLMEKPQGQWAPEIDQPNVYWLAKSNRVGCMWWDCQRKKWRNKTKIVQFETHMDDTEKQKLVNEQSFDLQCFLRSTMTVQRVLMIRPNLMIRANLMIRMHQPELYIYA